MRKIPDYFVLSSGRHIYVCAGSFSVVGKSIYCGDGRVDPPYPISENTPLTEDERKEITKFMIQQWTNFAKFGTTNP